MLPRKNLIVQTSPKVHRSGSSLTHERLIIVALSYCLRLFSDIFGTLTSILDPLFTFLLILAALTGPAAAGEELFFSFLIVFLAEKAFPAARATAMAARAIFVKFVALPLSEGPSVSGCSASSGSSFGPPSGGGIFSSSSSSTCTGLLCLVNRPVCLPASPAACPEFASGKASSAGSGGPLNWISNWFRADFISYYTCVASTGNSSDALFQVGGLNLPSSITTVSSSPNSASYQSGS